MEPVERIFALLDASGLEQKAFANSVGTFPSTVSAWKAGKSQSYKNYLPKIAEVLGTTVDYLLTGYIETGTTKAPTTESDDRREEAVRLLLSLPPELQDEAMRYVRYLKEKRDK
ncbi:hypothetical protein SDC9_153684 [bioreactor metagenome]|uniref:HTH cro/C1-type domain-containing protein n=1 Tax=bioreactor metagenome TaxID=1076179 RepID=A0A645EWK4_9ZZZZ